MYYTYLLKSKEGNHIYIGSTNNLKKRFRDHNEGKEIYTKRYTPWKLLYYEAYQTETLARDREKRLKYNGNALRELKKRIGIFKPLSPKSGAGFTLIEFLVVISIIGILSSALFFNWRSGEAIFALQNSAYKLAQNIRRVQNMAISTAECPGGTGCAGIVPSGYGIILRRPADWKYKYRLYADIDGDNAFSDSNDTVIELIDLEKGVFIKEIRRPSPPNPNFNWGCINFKPPDPIVNISLRDPDAYSAQLWTKITLALEADNTKTKTVKINAAGLIEIE